MLCKRRKTITTKSSLRTCRIFPRLLYIGQATTYNIMAVQCPRRPSKGKNTPVEGSKLTPNALERQVHSPSQRDSRRAALGRGGVEIPQEMIIAWNAHGCSQSCLIRHPTRAPNLRTTGRQILTKSLTPSTHCAHNSARVQPASGAGECFFPSVIHR